MDAREAADRIWLVLETLSAAHPDMGFKDGVLLAQKAYTQVEWARAEGVSNPPDPLGPPGRMPDPKNTMHFAEWLGGHESVTDHVLRTNGKIHAIKEARAVSGAGLKESRDAVELLAANPHWIKNR